MSRADRNPWLAIIQRFDKTWEEFIDINCNEELQDCDKLKIQILPGTH
jgi:hypothetical protein